MCGKKNIWSLNCQKLFITPLLEIFRPKISLIAENTDWFQHWSCRGPGDRSQLRLHILRHSLYLGIMMLCSAALISYLHSTDFMMMIFFCFKVESITKLCFNWKIYFGPISFYYIRQTECVVGTNGFYFPRAASWCLLAVTMGSRAAPPWPGSLVGGGRPLIGQAAYSLPIASQW